MKTIGLLLYVLRGCLALLALTIVSACAPSPMMPSSAAEPRVWPAPPETVRIAYAYSFSRPEDLGITKGFFARLGEWIVGAEQNNLVRPMAIVVTAEGMIYIADPGVQGVHRFDTVRHRYRLLRRAEDAPLPSPVGLALGPRGEVYVTDSALDAVFLIGSSRDKHVTPLALKAPLTQPTGIACDPATGQLYVVDTGNHQVKIFAPDGSLQSAFGRRGIGDGEFNYPTLMWRDNSGKLWVTDSLNFRVQVFDAAGRFLNKFGRLGDGSGDHARPKGVATDRAGHVYVVDSLHHAMQVFDTKGAFLLNVGEQGRHAGEFWLPTGIYIATDNHIYVADSYNQRVQVFRYVGGSS